MLIIKDLKNMLKMVKKDLQKLLTQLIEKGRLGLGAMGFHAYLQSNDIPFEGI